MRPVLSDSRNSSDWGITGRRARCRTPACSASDPIAHFFSNSHYKGTISRNKATMSITPSADAISQGMSIYEKLIGAINSDKARRVANLIGSSFRLLGDEGVSDVLESAFFIPHSCIAFFGDIILD
jgi:hypothetical protein